MPNFRQALRALFKSPFVTIVAALSLALGIGANAAIFSLFDEILLRPLPVRDPGQLVNLEAPGPKPGSQSCSSAGGCEVVFSYQMYRDLEEKQTVFTGLAGHREFNSNVAFRNQTLNTTGLLVSGSYFPTLGLRPALGRLFGPDDDKIAGGHSLAVLSYRFWQVSLGADSSVINQTITVNGFPMTIIGVGPPGFDGTTLGERPKVFVPLTMRGQMNLGFSGFTNRRAYWVYVFGRLKSGVSIDRARVAMNTVYHPIIQTVEAPLQSQKGMSPERLVLFNKKEVVLKDGARGQSDVQKEATVPLVLLLTVTAIVLLIACANIANLLLARAANRAMEMAVRLSLGASRAQLLTQLLTESVLLAMIGGVASLAVAQWTLSVMAQMLPPDASLNFQLNPAAVVFTGLMSIGTGLLFGLFPALHSTRPELITTLRAGAGNLSSGRTASRFRATLVTTQIALSTALLIGAGLFIKSLSNVSHVDLGVRVDNISTFAVSPELSGYDSVRSRALYMRLENELRALPGVTAVTASMIPLIGGSSWGTDVAVQGFTKGPDTDANSRLNEVGPGYFQTIGIQRLAGREFTDADVLGSHRVAIVNETFARKFGLLSRNGGANSAAGVVGKFMSTGGGNDSLNIEIVGLVRDAKYSDVKDTIPPLFFTPYRQDARIASMNFYVRSSLAPEQMLPTLPKLLKAVDPLLPIENLKSMPQQIRENIFLDRMISSLSAAFALLATLLAAIGLYGVLAYSVAQRTNEIGIRVALGADALRVRMLVLRQVANLTVIGGVIGIICALGLGRGARSMLFEIKGYDPVVFALSTLLLVAVSLAAGYVPARRASRIDPITALRYD